MKTKYADKNKPVRDKIVWVRLTADEKERLEKKLENTKYNVSSFIREFILKEITPIFK